METFKFPSDNKKTILALGPESAGNFSVYTPPSPLVKGGTEGGFLHSSKNFGDLLDENNFKKFQKAVLEFLKKNELKPDVILTDLHPLYKTTELGRELAKKYKAKHIQIQHHIAHIFSAAGEQAILNTKYQLPDTIFGIALDGTGYGMDGKIWGGEIFLIKKSKIKNQNDNSKFKILRIGKLEDQIMIGGELAIREPARMLISILSKFMDKMSICGHMERFYTHNQFELLYNQLQNNFNCVETSSTGRILDAASILLGFCGNKRNYKHEPIDLLEKNSTEPYADLRPKLQITNYKLQTNSKSQIKNPEFILLTTPLFKYLIKNLHKDKHCLAATAQLYIAQGLYEIISKKQEVRSKKQEIFIAGGIANNKIISSYLESKGASANKKIPRGDAGISFGQIIYYLTNSRD